MTEVSDELRRWPDGHNLRVTFRRRRSGREHVVLFQCGDDTRNVDAILREAWNSNSEIVAVVPDHGPAVVCGTRQE